MGSSTTAKVWKENASGQPPFPASYKVTKRWEGTCAELAKNSNKFYHAEIQVAPDGSARILTTYGRVGKAGTVEFRYYPSERSCLDDFESLVRKKRDRKKDAYREVELAITSVGSEGAKAIVKPMTGIAVPNTHKSTLHVKVQRIVQKWFGDAGRFVEFTLKCPLGQLSIEQIDKGRAVLDECRNRLNTKTSTDNTEWDKLTSQFYSLIPHVLPHKIDITTLRLNIIERIMERDQTLDTFLDVKNVSSVLTKDSPVDAQYAKLNANLQWLDPQDPIRQWIEKLFHETRAKNHSGLGKIKIFNVFKLLRNGELDYFSGSLQRIGKEIKGKGDKPTYTTLERPDLDIEERQTFALANVWPLWHGTKIQNMVGIIGNGLRIRPAGVGYCGSMYGDAVYFSPLSSKSCSYCGCRGAYWSQDAKTDSVYMFLNDVIVGKPHIVYAAKFFHKPPSGYHSVYALPGQGLYNPENIIYVPSGPNQQNRLRYIVEFQTNT